MSPVRSTLVISIPLVLALLVGPASLALEARQLTAADIPAFGGADFDAGVGDWLLQNDKLWAVVLDNGATPDFGIPFSAEALPSTGVLIDIGTVTDGTPDKNDQLGEIHHALNLDANSLILYGGPVVANVAGPTASLTVGGIALFPGRSTPSAPTIFVTTTYSMTDGNSHIDVTTTVTNSLANPPLPIFQISDADIFAGRGRLPFQPFPARGPKSPPLDLTNPFSSIGVFPYLATVGNLSAADGAVNNDGSPSGEVSYTYVADSLAAPFVGLANEQVVIVGNFFDLVSLGSGNPPLVDPGDSLTYDRKIAVAKRNDVESTLDVALPLLGLGLRATFSGRIVDGNGDGVPNAHIVFDNTLPGANLLLSFLVTPLDENQDGVPDGVVSIAPGDPVPSTHVLTDSGGNFTVRLPALGNPLATSSVYTGRIQAPERDTASIGPLTVDAAALGAPTDLGDLPLSEVGTLRFSVVDKSDSSKKKKVKKNKSKKRNKKKNDQEKGQKKNDSLPARIRITGLYDTENPDFGSQYLSVRDFSGLSKMAGDGLDPVTGGNSSQLSETLVGLPAFTSAAEPDGAGELELSPGSYLVRATRGLEYTTDAKVVHIEPGQTTHVKLRLERVVDTEGFVSADFHIHSARSFDSSAPPEDRVVSYASKGVEVLVSTDHDNITDYAPVIWELGLEHRATSIVGNELTGGVPVPSSAVPGGVDAYPEGIGHWNAWPVELIPGNRRNGAPQDEFMTPGTAIDRLRGMDSLDFFGATPDTATLADWLPAIQAGQPGTPGALLPPDEEVVMLNHPRAGFAGTVVIGVFNGLANPGGDPAVGGYDPDLPIGAFPNNQLLVPSLYNALVVGPDGTGTTALSFDALEVFNGPGVGRYLQVREDWFSLLKQGIHKTATAVADSHRVVLENAGFPRSYVASSTDAPASVDEDELTESIKAMRVIGTTGPFIRFEIKPDRGPRQGLGETVVATGSKVELEIRVDAAPWIPVEEVRIYRNGELIETLDIAPGKVLGPPVKRFDRKVKLSGVGADSFFTVEAGVSIDANGQPLDPGLVEDAQEIEPDIVPLGFTNPIFVDRDGDGYTPPGL